MEKGTKVYKSTPEELQILAEVESLISELKTQGGAGPGYDDGGGNIAGGPGAAKGCGPVRKQDKLAAPGEITGAPNEDNNAMDDEVKKDDDQDDGTAKGPEDLRAEKSRLEKALDSVKKAIEETAHDGADALSSAEDKLEDIPEYDEEDVNELARGSGVSKAQAAKMMASMRQIAVRKATAKRQEQVQKSQIQRLNRLENLLGEVLSGIAAAGGMIQEPVRKSAQDVVVQKSGRKPLASYDKAIGGEDMETFAEHLVQKALAAAGVTTETKPVDDFERGTSVHKGMREFTSIFGDASRAAWNQ